MKAKKAILDYILKIVSKEPRRHLSGHFRWHFLPGTLRGSFGGESLKEGENRENHPLRAT